MKLAAAVTVGALLLTGCSAGSDSGTTAPVSDADIEKALKTPTDLTFWTWVPDIEKEVALFEDAYPAINVKVVNVGQGADHYAKLRTALEAGEGAPDVAQIEYQHIQSFRVTDSLLDLSAYGASDLADEYVDWVWNQVAEGDSVYAIPQDTGPLGNLYREDIFTQAGVTSAPATWAEYADAAKKVKDATGSYIYNFGPNEAGVVLGLLWQAGVKPFSYDGKETVTIDLTTDTSKQVMSYWQDLIQKDLVATDPMWTDEWYQGLANGKYAGWLTAAWGPIFLQGTAGSTSGLWRASELPQWKAGDHVSGNWGGSSDAVLKTSKNPIAAYELAKWINNDSASTTKFATEQFLFPASRAVLESDEFVNQEPEFYGGQKVNQLFADISGTVDKDFEWLPFMTFAYSSYGETFGAAVAKKGDLNAGLQAWEDALISYGTDQGFTVNP